ncbi:ethanolamine ammonia-lyase subunit EutC [Gordonia sp. LSe1-13]|uniref:Ethanolamine ammonia-lyase small subunit n=1 Tax=Gordonia sesuvii TaxID=3116777 RepID=A0ABU7MJ13_9ACTN|nr:ethanolamine ammonia-lyase subunit EutC [Gordonia sp. LSe1-13]
MSGTDLDPRHDAWARMRAVTPARIGLGFTGISQPTRTVLRFTADHAVARDAVRSPLDVDSLGAQLREIGIGPATHVRSRASTRSEYLRRPDLGRVPAVDSAVAHSGADVGVVIADGLSARAVQQHSVPFLRALISTLGDRYRFAPPVVATQARVALGDHVGQALGVETVLVLIGERPGLTVAESMGIYLTHHPYPGRRDAERNCVSNIHRPGGLSHTDAADVCAALIDGARRLGRSGVDLKDVSRDTRLAARDRRELP